MEIVTESSRMPFLRTSIMGLAAAAVCLVTAAIAINDTRYMDGTTWGLLGLAFGLDQAPRPLLFGSILSPLALAALAAGLTLFAIDASGKL